MRAVLSVSDKTGIVELARELVSKGCEILSTGGTARLLNENRVAVTPISEYTGSPEILGGRVKTLHPMIHGGILAKNDQEAELARHGIGKIDLVVVNLYPFQETVKENPPLDEAIEQIDIGGVTLIRAAAKNFSRVTVICDPADYKYATTASDEKRKELAVKAFRHTAEYDTAINSYLGGSAPDEISLRYGENPHQTAVFRPDGTDGIGNAEQLHGKELSYNNYLDGNSAWNVVHEISGNAVCVVKHLNPCGIATGKTVKSALEAAWSGDIVSAFGSVIAFSEKVDLETAEFLKGKFVEVVIAPEFDDNALEFLRGKSENLRVLKAKPPTQGPLLRTVSGGILEQSHDNVLCKEWKSVTKTTYPKEKNPLGEFTMIACKNTKSNAVILGIEYESGYYKVLGMGAGQPNRVDSLKKLAVTKAKENIERDGGKLTECVLASDAFFPFDDTVREAAAYGIKLIIQPGGSIRDEEVIKACDELGVAMIFTGTRHFNH